MGGSFEGEWAWSKYGADFIKEDGEWKMWHMHLYPIFKSDYDKSWVYSPPVDFDGNMMGRKIEYNEWRRPTHGVTYNYGVKALYPRRDPEPPKPYGSWDEIGYGY